jgi:hypothetical protein
MVTLHVVLAVGTSLIVFVCPPFCTLYFSCVSVSGIVKLQLIICTYSCRPLIHLHQNHLKINLNSPHLNLVDVTINLAVIIMSVS